ncbi:O-antigen ligase family protein [Novosphingobium gossypii]|uniref:O-antigen ligase family protein n=1 Tax=Novosphingobium gossypii TaxID=1604774 RepID=UPI003D20F41D
MNAGRSGFTPWTIAGMLAAAAILFAVARPGFYGACVSTACVLGFVKSLRPDLRQDMAVRAVLITFFMPAIAWVLPSVWLLYFVMALWVPIFARRPDQIAGVYLHSLLLLPGLDLAVEPGGLKLFEVGVHDALALGAVVAIRRTGGGARIAGKDDLRVALLLLVLVFASARSTSFTHFLRTTINIAFDFGLPYYILSRALGHASAMRSAMRWFACSGTALAGILVFEAWQSWPMYNELYWHYGVQMLLIVKSRGAMMRPGGPFNEPTSIALVMVLCLFALWLIRDDFRTRVRHGLLCLLVFLGASTPQSRNAWVAFGIAVLLGDVFLGRWAALVRKVVPTAAAVTLILVAAQVWPSFSESLGLSGQGSDTADYRRDLLRRGTEEFWASPIVGFSRDELEVRLNDMRQGEGIIDFVNTYLWFALVAGVIGLVAFLWNLGAPLFSLWRRRGLAETAIPAVFVFGCLAALGATLFFTFFATRMAFLTLGFMGFAAAIRAAGRGQTAAPPPPRPSPQFVGPMAVAAS